MFIMDVPYVPAQESPIVIVQVDVFGAGSKLQPDYLLTECKEIPSLADPTLWSVDPAGWLVVELGNRSNRDLYPAAVTVKITLLEGTTHGKLIAQTGEGRLYYVYDAEPGYEGKDKAIFMAEFEGKRYKVVVDLRVAPVEAIPDNDQGSPVCPAPKLIKVNKPASGSLGYDLNTIPVTFADLSGSAIGQTNTSGITLDTTASSYNWFIDSTPSMNEEFVPTSNPNEWVAAGSEAAGKMDIFSVRPLSGNIKVAYGLTSDL